jgi:hypothetical protein
MNHIYKKIKPVLLLTIVLFSGFINARKGEVVNYYGIPESLTFNNLNYTLSWSSHPNAVYYKQEYIPKEDNINRFHDMVLIDFIQGDITVRDAVQGQVNKILERKKIDPVCNYQILTNTDKSEFLIDFLMSQSSSDEVNLIEWSAYHYKMYSDKAGHKGILLFGICHRAYDDNTGLFLNSLKDFRNKQLKILSDFPFPEIQIK